MIWDPRPKSDLEKLLIGLPKTLGGSIKVPSSSKTSVKVFSMWRPI